jgi:hypothetical protein
MKIIVHYKKIPMFILKCFKSIGIILSISIFSLTYICVTVLLGAYLLGNHIHLHPHAFFQLINTIADFFTGIFAEAGIAVFIFSIHIIFQFFVEILEDNGIIEIKR